MKKSLVKKRSDLGIKFNDSCLVVVCSSCGNPDFRQNPNESISETINIPCKTFGEASKACTTYIEDNELGSGNWSGGQIYHPTKGYIAFVSYNGRVWKPLDINTNCENMIRLDENASDC